MKGVTTILNSDTKKAALDIHKRAVDKYNSTVRDVHNSGERLYSLRKKSVICIEMCESFINSIANTPKDFDTKLVRTEANVREFRVTEKYADEAYKEAVKSGVGVAAGVGFGATVAAMAPTAAMWVATTFGTASTGTAIASLSGAVATKAALAWLGGGALAAGGAGMAGGQALLALAGPIGWGLATAIAGGNAIFLGAKNNKIAKQAIDEAKTITFAGAQLKETGTIIDQLANKTESVLELLENQLVELRPKNGCHYADLSSDEQLRLGSLVNNALSMAELLNEKVS